MAASFQFAYRLDYQARDGRNFSIEQTGQELGLRVDFNIQKNTKKDLNRAVIGITNPSETTIGALQSDGFLRFQAGYAGDIATILVGEKQTINITDDGATKRAEILLLEGNTSGSNLNFARNYGIGTNTTLIITDLINFLVEASPSIEGFNAFSIDVFNTYLEPQIVFGNAFELLTKFLGGIGYQWWINNGVITVLKRNEFTRDIEVPLNNRTGMIGSPRRISTNAQDATSFNGVEVQSIFNYNFDVGRRLRLNSKFFNDESFRIDSVTFQGDSYTGEAQCNVRALDIRSVEVVLR